MNCKVDLKYAELLAISTLVHDNATSVLFVMQCKAKLFSKGLDSSLVT